MARNNRNLLNLGTLRLLAIVAPVAFALALGLTTALFLNDALPGLCEEVTAAPDMQGLLNSIVVRAKDLLGTDVAALMLLSLDGSELDMAAEIGLQTRALRARQV